MTEVRRVLKEAVPDPSLDPIYVAFEFPTALAAKQAWDRCHRKARKAKLSVSAWRFRNHATGTNNLLVIMGEAKRDDQVRRAAALAVGQMKVKPYTAPDDMLACARRRFGAAVEGLRTGQKVDKAAHFGEGGAILTPEGEVEVKRRYG